MRQRSRYAFVAVVITVAVSSSSLLPDTRYSRAQGPDTAGDGMMGQGMIRGGMMRGGMMGHGMEGQEMMGQNWGSDARHRQFMTSGVPEPYASMRDPLPDTLQVLACGRTVFDGTCASCHGARGLGNGEAGSELSPPPSNLVALAAMPMMRSDPYLYWVIAEGGAAIGTGMPAFKGALTSDDIWSVVQFLQAGLPGAGLPGADLPETGGSEER